uniref:Immunoglobulin V-set domain-containing protein n=1 Tax=Cyprinus carpio TaxID=7962 RepID=A0A8C2GZW2_CYPCA
MLKQECVKWLRSCTGRVKLCHFTFSYKLQLISALKTNEGFNLILYALQVCCVEMLSLMEGNSVLLHNNVATIHEDDDILWKFGAENSLIAQINRENQTFPDERFRDRLKLDRQTGSLTIMNTRTQHAGRYELEINGKRLSTKTFSVSVYETLTLCQHTTPKTRLLCTCIYTVCSLTFQPIYPFLTLPETFHKTHHHHHLHHSRIVHCCVQW